MNNKYRFLVLLLVLSVNITAFTQILDDQFKFALTKSRTITRFQAMAKQADGKIVVIGDPLLVNGGLHSGIIRLNTDLTLDENFTGLLPLPTFFAQSAMAIQADGKIVLAGVFGNGPNGESYKGLVRLNTDGTIDESLNIGTGFNPTSIRALGIDPNGKYIIFGNFTQYNGATANAVARINPDGSLDNTFNSPPGFTMTSNIEDLHIQADGKIILAAPGMSVAGPTVLPKVIRLNADGSLDNTFNYSAPLSSSVYLLEPEPTGDKVILIGIGFVRRLNSDGSLDNTYTGSAGSTTPRATIRQSDNKIIIAGGSTAVRINTDGTIDNSFTFGGQAGNFRGVSLDNSGNILLANALSSTIQLLNSSGTALTPLNFTHTEPGNAFQPEIVNDQILLPGNFQFLDGNPVKSLISVTQSGALTPGFDYFSSDPVSIVHKDADHFFTTDASVTSKMVRVNSNGTLDTDYTTNILSAVANGGTISPLLRLRNGKLLVAGTTDLISTTFTKIILLNANGSIDNSFVSPAGLAHVHDAAELPDGRIIISDSHQSSTKDSLKIVSTTGLVDPTFKVGFNIANSISDIIADNSGTIYAGGFFTAMNGITVNSLVKLSTSGVADLSFIQGTGFSGSVNSLALQRDQKLLVGGLFSLYNGEQVKGFVRLNSDGTRDATLTHPFTGTVGGVKIIGDDIYLTGTFVRSYSPYSSSIARYITNLSVPANVAGGSDCSSVNLTWSDTSTEETNFIIERSENPAGPFQIVATTGANTVTYKDEGLAVNTTYYYRIKAANGIGEANPSAVLTIGTLTPAPVVPVITADQNIICPGKTATLSITTGTLSPGAQWRWYSESCGGTSVGTGASITVSPTVTTTYYVRAEGNCVLGNSCVSITLSVGIPNITSTTPAIKCGEGTVVVSATASSGDIKWYDAAMNGNLLGTGVSFETPTISTTTTYYAVATAKNNECASAASSITATIKPIPDAATLITGNTIAASASDVTYQWINCNDNNAPITGETGQTFQVSSSGNYAVHLTQDGCSVTSDCVTMLYTGFEEFHSNNPFAFPNPSRGKFSIAIAKTSAAYLTITDSHGKLIYSSHVNSIPWVEINLMEQPAGVYLLTVFDGNSYKHTKLMVE